MAKNDQRSKTQIEQPKGSPKAISWRNQRWGEERQASRITIRTTPPATSKGPASIKALRTGTSITTSVIRTWESLRERAGDKTRKRSPTAVIIDQPQMNEDA
ncbi:hypothetical protein RTCCBAU85039_2820 [Rhizobium tibeticum]|uniref:Uncharacterized protein n=1 Tax=Rhizobium tibeticum TaxID=501024 RepID=A0A1K0J1F0_9HYPH|nr:hypothetical protein RTCCBAU85039_2820 [Rhizobium tibeticum]